MDTTPLDVTVVVPTYNQSGMLRRLMDSFDKLTFSGKFEIIIVDDCSTDNTVQTIEAWLNEPHAFEARFVGLKKNGGPGIARNEGARAGRGRIVAYTDTDCIVTPGWLENLVQQIDPESKIVGVGGKVLAQSEASMAARYYVFHEVLEPPWANQYLVSCNCCFLREEMLAVGGFEEDIPRPGGEDIAVSIRLWKQGWRFAYEPKAVIYHDFNSTLKNFRKTWWSYGAGTALVCMRLLKMEELYPEWGRLDVDNYWDARSVRPTVTGLRSFFKTLLYHYGQCVEAGLTWKATAELLLMWVVDRWSYLRGWKQGVRQYKKEQREQQKNLQQP